MNFPTLRPDNFPACQAEDMQASANANVVSTSVMIGISLTNNMKSPCALNNPADISLLDGNNLPVVVPIEALKVDANPSPGEAVVLSPGSPKIISIVLENYCQKDSTGRIKFRINLEKGQSVDISVSPDGLIKCSSGSDNLKIKVAPYSDPP